MFKVEQLLDDNTRFYTKVHFASTREVAEEIKRDLSRRFGEMFLTEEALAICGWDPGGMLMVDDKTFSFLLSNITIECMAQHFDYFVGHVQRREPRGGGVKYIKLHGRWACICITPYEHVQLKKLLTDPDFAAQAAQVWGERQRRLNKLAAAGVIERVGKNPINKNLS
jgi:hypothetical protein